MLKPAARRALVFVTMVTVGLSAVFLLQEEDSNPRSGPQIGKVDANDPETLTFETTGEGGDLRVKVGETEFFVQKLTLMPSGKEEMRNTYRIHFLKGSPGPTGDFLVEQPHVTFLDGVTGDERGSLRADHGRFLSDQAIASSIAVDLTNFQTKDFELWGDVHGTLPLDGEVSTSLNCESLETEGEIVRGPGEVTWRRGEMLLVGTDMEYDDTTQEIAFDRDVVVTLDGEIPEQRATLHSPKGVRYQLRPGTDRQGYATFFGPVSGQAGDGSRLEADTLDLSADSKAMTLTGHALLDIKSDEQRWKITADTLTARRPETGGFELTHAQGHVLIDAPEAEPPMWLATERLDSAGSLLVAQGPVKTMYQGLSIAGVGMRWDQGLETLELDSDVVLVGSDAMDGSSLPGLRVEAAQGLSLEGPSGDRRLRLEGPVRGTQPGLGDFSGDLLTYVESQSLLVLEGQASATLEDELTGTSRTLRASELSVVMDDLGAPAAITCRDEVLLQENREDGLARSIRSQWLHITGTRLSTPEPVDVSWENYELTGTGLRFDDLEGRLDIASDVRITQLGETLGGGFIDARAGLTWWLPQDAARGANAGHGEFRGPVSGESADGMSFSAQYLKVTEDKQEIILRGGALLSWGTDSHLASEELLVTRSEGGLRASSPVEVVWSRSQMEGRGTGLKFDEAAGRIHFEHSVQMVFRSPSQPTPARLACDGSFTWTAPPGAVDPLRQGVGELRDNVTGSDGQGITFSTERIVLDGPGNRLECFGETRLERLGDDERFLLETEQDGYVRFVTDENRDPVSVDARGRVTIGVSLLKAVSDTLSWDVPADDLILDGNCRLLAVGFWQTAPRMEIKPRVPSWFFVKPTLGVDEKR